MNKPEWMPEIPKDVNYPQLYIRGYRDALKWLNEPCTEHRYIGSGLQDDKLIEWDLDPKEHRYLCPHCMQQLKEGVEKLK